MVHTHEAFIEKLLTVHEGYIRGEFVVYGRFISIKKKLLIKDKYGFHKVLPSDLLNMKCKNMTVKSAIFKTNYIKEYLHQNIKAYFKRDFRLISDYILGKQPAIFKDNHGNSFLMSVSNVLARNKPSIKSVINKDEFIIKKLYRQNKGFKNGEFDYISHFNKNQTIILILSDLFGTYNMDSSSAYNGSKPTIEVATDKNKNLVKRLEQNGGDYDYSKVVYSKMNDKLTIGCKLHGDYKQRSYNHIRGEGCERCGRISTTEKLSDTPTGWSHSSWISWAEKSKNFDSFKCYILEIKSVDNKESFFKVGRTYTTIKNRFKYIDKFYYIDKVIKVFESDDAKYIIDKELELLKNNKIYKYKPLKNFGGSQECFTKVEYEEI